MNIIAIFLYSMWHIFLPGESTPILIALRAIGTAKKSVLKIGIGLAISNGFIMILCLCLGVFLPGNLEQYATTLDIIARLLVVFIFFAVSVYILIQLKKYSYEKESQTALARKSFFEKHSFKSGLLVGIIPSPADLGFMLIGSMMPPKKLWTAVAAIWLGVIISFTLLSYLIGFSPMEMLKEKYNKYVKWLHILTLICLFLIGIWLFYMLCKDYSYYF
jgi:hypothetical protein